jgi:glycosyltransferase involved in cell wall biosynthesis
VSAPLVTLGVPVYNGQRYLARALDSLLAQTFDDFEIVLCDNASEDRTAEICAAYAARDPASDSTGIPRTWGWFATSTVRSRWPKGHTSYGPDDDWHARESLELTVKVLEAIRTPRCAAPACRSSTRTASSTTGGLHRGTYDYRSRIKGCAVCCGRWPLPA